jgi:hypothetical protein
MAKNIVVESSGIVSEETTLKKAIAFYLSHKIKEFALLRLASKDKNMFVPNQHIYIADAKNCKSLLEKLK